MTKIRIAPAYTEEWVEIHRPQPLSSNALDFEILEILNGNIDKDISNNVYAQFKAECREWILASNVNHITGLAELQHVDISIGCTQFIDNCYMQGPVQVLFNDYRYHERLKLAHRTSPGCIKPNVPLIIAMPFPSIGDIHPEIDEILNECVSKGVRVYIDACWYTCCKGINFDITHPAIDSIGFSLSKGLGLGWNRVGLRFSKEKKTDSISIMNDFDMNNKVLVKIGQHFIRKFEPDYLWNFHQSRIDQVCKDFNLTQTKSNYLALRNGHPVGISPLIRYLENEKK